MPVTCPHCQSRYLLPAALLGPGGARVRCPRCREAFAVGPDGLEIAPVPAHAETPPAGNGSAAAHAGREAPPRVPATAAGPPSGAEAKAHAGPPRLPASAFGPIVSPPAAEAVQTRVPEPGGGPAPETPEAVARRVLDELAAHSGEAIAASRADGRLFKEFGAVIAEAYEFYRRRVGSNADPAAFRAALRERWGVDLEPLNPPRRMG